LGRTSENRLRYVDYFVPSQRLNYAIERRAHLRKTLCQLDPSANLNPLDELQEDVVEQSDLGRIRGDVKKQISNSIENSRSFLSVARVHCAFKFYEQRLRTSGRVHCYYFRNMSVRKGFIRLLAFLDPNI
jgi:hypothetical protein